MSEIEKKLHLNSYKYNKGWFLCVQNYLNKVYGEPKCESNSILKFKIRPEFFQIKTPYLMNSSAVKIAKNICNERSKRKKDKKKKKNAILNDKTCDTYSNIDHLVNKGSSSLIQTAQDLHLLDNPDISSTEWFENNSTAREAAKDLKKFESYHPSTYHNGKSIPTLIQLGKEDYILPENSTFHLCDISSISCLTGEKYNLIVLDPPWENKSVRRNKKYATSSCELLLDLPIENLCFPGCLIVIWVTNNQRQINYIKEKLFPKWNISEFVMWHWLKVTQKGRFIHPIDWHHKKPYENLILARIPFEDNIANNSQFMEPEPHKIIVSIPSSIHSHKPPLAEVLEPYVSNQPKCLELFARYLLPGWTSMGNEVLKLQNIKLFEKQS